MANRKKKSQGAAAFAAYLKLHGIGYEAVAGALGTNVTTLSLWCTAIDRPNPVYRQKIERFAVMLDPVTQAPILDPATGAPRSAVPWILWFTDEEKLEIERQRPFVPGANQAAPALSA